MKVRRNREIDVVEHAHAGALILADDAHLQAPRREIAVDMARMQFDAHDAPYTRPRSVGRFARRMASSCQSRSSNGGMSQVWNAASSRWRSSGGTRPMKFVQ